jgi:hypothetical protein
MPPLLEKLLPGLYNGIATAKFFWAKRNVTVIAGGDPVAAFQTGSAAVGPNIYTGSGVPTVSAPQGSLYLRTDGSSTSTRLYVNTNGSTTWTAVTTAA